MRVRVQGELLQERAEARSTPASLRARFRKQACHGTLYMP